MIHLEGGYPHLVAPVRNIKGEVELYNSGSTEPTIIPYDGDLMKITVERAGEAKFFGYGICAKANFKIRDVERKYSITTDNYIKVKFDGIYCLPNFYVTEVHRDEKTNELSITAYDALYSREPRTTSDIKYDTYSFSNYLKGVAAALGVGLSYDWSDYDFLFDSVPNFEGTEPLRDALNAIAEVLGAVYFINHKNELTFGPMHKGYVAPDITLTKEDYFELKSRENRRLSAVCFTNELGDGITIETGETGTTQYIRDNAFFELSEFKDTIANIVFDFVGGLTINQFECEWRGNYLLQPLDVIEIVGKDNKTISVRFLNDVLTYDGSLKQRTEWEYQDKEETDSNPSNLGDALKQTFARVDKVEKEITLMASEVAANSANISSLTLTTNDISAEVVKNRTEIDTMNGEIIELTNKVAATMTSEEIKFEIEQAVNDEVTEVTTTTGFTFDADGLTITKSESEMKTEITEDGMTIYKSSDEVLTANNQGVKAKDLHATTYLIIGENSRLEDTPDGRTACFWIGG